MVASPTLATRLADRAVAQQRPLPHPNEMDRRRIERGLEGRRRYRYVTPTVTAIEGGYFITSPCCSRNIDPAGGVIEIARLEYVSADGSWRLLRKDHYAQRWIGYGTYLQLSGVLDVLRDDPHRCFWQ